MGSMSRRMMRAMSARLDGDEAVRLKKESVDVLSMRALTQHVSVAKGDPCAHDH